MKKAVVFPIGIFIIVIALVVIFMNRSSQVIVFDLQADEELERLFQQSVTAREVKTVTLSDCILVIKTEPDRPKVCDIPHQSVANTLTIDLSEVDVIEDFYEDAITFLYIVYEASIAAKRREIRAAGSHQPHVLANPSRDKSAQPYYTVKSNLAHDILRDGGINSKREFSNYAGEKTLSIFTKSVIRLEGDLQFEALALLRKKVSHCVSIDRKP